MPSPVGPTAAQQHRRSLGLGPGQHAPVLTPTAPVPPRSVMPAYQPGPRPADAPPPAPAVAQNNYNLASVAPGSAGSRRISDLIADIVNKGGPLMQQAQTQGAKLAQRRGLGSSSIAIGAAQNEVYKVAAPIGIAEGQIASAEMLARERNRLEEIMQTRQLTANEQLQLRDIQNQQYQQGRDINSREYMQGRQIGSDQFMQGRAITSTEKLASERNRLEELMQTRALTSNEKMQLRDITSQQTMQSRDLGSRAGLAQAQRELDRHLASLDRDTQMRITGMNLDAADRGQVASLMANYQSTYEGQIEAINANENLSGTARAAQTADLRARRESYLAMVSDMYDTDISWQGGEAPPSTIDPVKDGKSGKSGKSSGLPVDDHRDDDGRTKKEALRVAQRTPEQKRLLRAAL
jgi:hypothetical protein